MKKKSGMQKKVEKSMSNDIIKLILKDHKPLKALIKKMKSEKADFDEVQNAYEEFVPLLLSHADAEEQALYTYLKEQEDLRQDGFEGQVEHKLASQMADAAKESDDEDLTRAEIKVLAELVEHHIKEEEEDILPDFKKEANAEVRNEIGEKYLNLKDQGEVQDHIHVNKGKKIDRAESRRTY